MIKRGLVFATVLLAATLVSPALLIAGETVQFELGPWPVIGVIQCTNESISGTLAEKGHITTTANNNTVHVRIKFISKVELEGVSGRKYTGRGESNESFQLAPGTDYQMRVRYRLIAQGEDGGDDDFFYTQTIRFHLTPNGDVQQDLGETSVECR